MQSDSWEAHIKDVRAWADTTIKMHHDIQAIYENTKHLGRLSDIAGELRMMRTSLIAPATSRAFIPLWPGVALFTFMTFALVLVGTIKIADRMPTLNKISVTPNSISAE